MDNAIAMLRDRVQHLLPGRDVGLALGVILLLSVLVLPLPRVMLDIGLALSITASVLVLMVAMFLAKPLEFTSFPTLLLLTTLLRLALNVATTRLILAHGSEGKLAAGHVVAAFGGLLMGGDVLIGLILFAILLVVNFMVITKGSGRIAEVAARFSLDAMPGKQMAIDADLSAGMVDEKEARRRRRELEEESGFYGAMDGAAKFVRGDAIAALIITCINIVGGLAIGVLRHGMGFADAANTYTTLTVGDGLVSQIPSLLVSTAAGIVVTKGGMHGSTEATLVRQLGGVRPLVLAGGAAGVLALMPGLPMLEGAGNAGRGRAAAAGAGCGAANFGHASHRPDPHRTRLRAAGAGGWRGAPTDRADQGVASHHRGRAGLRDAGGSHPGQHGSRPRGLRHPHQGDRGRAGTVAAREIPCHG
jgi:flagellar biosynthesis protein FlhA